MEVPAWRVCQRLGRRNMTIVAPNSETIFPVCFFLRRLPFLPTQIGSQACDPHPKFLTWGVVSKTTLIMHACIINVLVLTVYAKDIDYARVRN